MAGQGEQCVGIKNQGPINHFQQLPHSFQRIFVTPQSWTDQYGRSLGGNIVNQFDRIGAQSACQGFRQFQRHGFGRFHFHDRPNRRRNRRRHQSGPCPQRPLRRQKYGAAQPTGPAQHQHLSETSLVRIRRSTGQQGCCILRRHQCLANGSSR